MKAAESAIDAIIDKPWDDVYPPNGEQSAGHDNASDLICIIALRRAVVQIRVSEREIAWRIELVFRRQAIDLRTDADVVPLYRRIAAIKRGLADRVGCACHDRVIRRGCGRILQPLTRDKSGERTVLVG